MKIRYLIFATIIFSIVFILGCLEEAQKEENVVAETNSTLQNELSINSITSGEVIGQMNCLEKLLKNDNYFFVQNSDTQFIYFTRVNTESIYTYQYKMFQGDSAQLKLDTIQQNRNRIVWNWNGKEIFLDSVSNKIARWVNTKNQVIVEFKKNDKSEISFINETKKQFNLIKTPQISLFLSRSFYDYKNGTHFAFDTSNFTKKKK